MSARNLFLGIKKPSDPNPITRTYVSDGDTNGVFYFIGQNYSTSGIWTNPYTAGRLAITSQPVGRGALDDLVDRASDDFFLSPVTPSWIVFDFGAGRSLIPNKISYRQRTPASSTLTIAYDVEGSNDGSTWTTLKNVTGIPATQDVWTSSDITPPGTAYRYIRLVRVTNDDSSTHFTPGEIEIYGTFTY